MFMKPNCNVSTGLTSGIRPFAMLLACVLAIPATLYAKDYKARLIGKWNTISMTDGDSTRKIPSSKTLTWDFLEDGTLIVRTGSDGKEDSNTTTWKQSGDTILLGNSGGKPDIIHFAFYDDFMVLSRHPDDNFVLQKLPD